MNLVLHINRNGKVFDVIIKNWLFGLLLVAIIDIRFAQLPFNCYYCASITRVEIAIMRRFTSKLSVEKAKIFGSVSS